MFKTIDIQEATADDLSGVRYYLEMIDESGGVLASLTEYMTGEVDEIDVLDQPDSAGFSQGWLPMEGLDPGMLSLARNSLYSKRIHSGGCGMTQKRFVQETR